MVTNPSKPAAIAVNINGGAHREVGASIPNYGKENHTMMRIYMHAYVVEGMKYFPSRIRSKKRLDVPVRVITALKETKAILRITGKMAMVFKKRVVPGAKVDVAGILEHEASNNVVYVDRIMVLDNGKPMAQALIELLMKKYKSTCV
jgi:hypothetical protein